MGTADASTPRTRSLRQEREANADRDALEEADQDRPDGRGDRDHEVEPMGPPELSQGAHLDQAKNRPDHDRCEGGRRKVLERLREEQQDGKHPERGGHARELRAPADHLDHGRARGARTGRDPPDSPEARFAEPSPSRSRFASTSYPLRCAKALELTIVSAAARRAIAAENGMSATTSAISKAGRPIGGRPAGSDPTSSTSEKSPPANPTATAAATITS